MQNHIQKNYRKNNSTLNILFEDSDIIVCEKPHGTATQSRRIGSPDMVNLIKRHIYETSSDKSEPYLAVIHRLDQPVRGILVFAKTPAAAKEFRLILLEHWKIICIKIRRLTLRLSVMQKRKAQKKLASSTKSIMSYEIFSQILPVPLQILPTQIPKIFFSVQIP